MTLFDIDEPQPDIVGIGINNSSSFDEDEQDIDFGLQDLRLASEEKD